MRVSIVCNCALLAITLLVPASEGRTYPWQKSTYLSRYGKFLSREGRLSHHQPQKPQQVSELKQLFDETLEELLQSTDLQRLSPRPPSRPPSRLSHRPITNEIPDLVSDIDPANEALYSATVAEREEYIGDASRQRQLTSEYQNYHEEVCEVKKTWTLINETLDVDGHEVEIINTSGNDRQYVYNFECVTPCSACRGVKVQSSCKMRYGFVKMYHRLKYDYRREDPTWGFVRVPSHCACELGPNNEIGADCYN